MNYLFTVCNNDDGEPSFLQILKIKHDYKKHFDLYLVDQRIHCQPDSTTDLDQVLIQVFELYYQDSTPHIERSHQN